jgi:L-glyceraldehyde 3-phosphate reductase
VPADSRAGREGSFDPKLVTQENIERIRALNAIAERRGQTLAQMAIAWVLRDPRVTSALVGARTVAQLEDTLTALQKLDFAPEELAEIDGHATEGEIDLWKVSSTL